jgi:hypothetical protein
MPGVAQLLLAALLAAKGVAGMPSPKLQLKLRPAASRPGL